MAKTTAVQMTTPKGIANYPYLNEPDTKFNADGEYKVNLSLSDTPSNRAFITKLETLRDKLLSDYGQFKEAKAKNKKPIIKDVFEENEEGELVLKFKQKALIRTKDGKTFEKRVALFDRLGKPVTDLIGYGSTIKVCFDVIPFYTPSTKLAGVTLRLVAVQVIDLKSGSTIDASAYGFTEEEGTYEASESHSVSSDIFADDAEGDEDSSMDDNSSVDEASNF